VHENEWSNVFCFICLYSHVHAHRKICEIIRVLIGSVYMSQMKNMKRNICTYSYLVFICRHYARFTSNVIFWSINKFQFEKKSWKKNEQNRKLPTVSDYDAMLPNRWLLLYVAFRILIYFKLLFSLHCFHTQLLLWRALTEKIMSSLSWYFCFVVKPPCVLASFVKVMQKEGNNPNKTQS
jgi:hypothetical protein